MLLTIGRIELGDDTKDLRFTNAMHYGTKPGHLETSKIHFPTSEEVSKESEREDE